MPQVCKGELPRPVRRRPAGVWPMRRLNSLVLVVTDRRLLRAAQAEGLLTFDPETQTQAELDAFLGP